MGQKNSVPSSFEDFSALKRSFAILQTSYQFRIKHGYDLIKELSEIISQAEALQIKCRQEQQAAVHKQIQSSEPSEKNLQALSHYLHTLLSDLKEWRTKEEENTMRLKMIELRMDQCNEIVQKVESEDANTFILESKESSVSAVD